MSERKNLSGCPTDYSCRFGFHQGRRRFIPRKSLWINEHRNKARKCGPLGKASCTRPDPWIIPLRTANSILLSFTFFHQPGKKPPMGVAMDLLRNDPRYSFSEFLSYSSPESLIFFPRLYHRISRTKIPFHFLYLFFLNSCKQ